MKIVIVGAGNVGLASAEAATRNHDVLIIEKDPAKAEIAKNTLPVSVLREDGSNPKALRGAIERINADVVLSAVPDDGMNLFICMMAKQIRPSVRTVACIRNPDYMSSSVNHAGVDLLISPETIAADKIVKLAMLENAVTFDDLGFMNLCLTTFRVEKGHDIVGKTIMNLGIPHNCSVVAVYRGDDVLISVATEEIHADDRLCVLATWDATLEFNKLIGIKKEAREFVILGAGPIGISVAKTIAKDPKKRFVKIIENDLEKCKAASRLLSDVIVVHGDIVDPLVLHSESVDRADVLISVSSMDEQNLLACMAALRFGISKIITRYTTKEYDEIFKYTGIESIVGYHKVIINEITKNLEVDSSALIIMEHPDDFFFSVTVDETMPLMQHYLGDVTLPEGVRITAIIRDGKLIFPRLGTMFAKDDRLLVYTHMVDPVQLSRVLGHETPEL